MLIIFPLCGHGIRFQNENYKIPKPLIMIHGKPMILHIIEKLNLNNNDDILYICPIYFKTFNIEYLLNVFGKIIYLYEPTNGALDTCTKGLLLHIPNPPTPVVAAVTAAVKNSIDL